MSDQILDQLAELHGQLSNRAVAAVAEPPNKQIQIRQLLSELSNTIPQSQLFGSQRKFAGALEAERCRDIIGQYTTEKASLLDLEPYSFAHLGALVRIFGVNPTTEVAKKIMIATNSQAAE